MKMNENTVKERIRVALNANGANPTNLAKRFGVNQKTLNNQINGDTSLSVSTILLIKEAIPDVSIEWLIMGEGEMLKQKKQPVDADFALQVLNEKDKKIEELIRDNERKEQELSELKKRYSNSATITTMPTTTSTSMTIRK